MYQTNIPLYTSTGLNNTTNNNPVTRFSVEQYQNQYANQLQQLQNPQQQQPSLIDSYTDYITTFRSCSKTIQDKIYNDPSYRKAEYNFESLKNQAIDEIIIPQLLNTQAGKTRAEELYQITLKCKEFYEQQESENNNKVQQLINDYNNPEALKLRLQELENNNQSIQTQVTESVVATQNVVQESAKQNNNNQNNNQNKNKHNSGGNN